MSKITQPKWIKPAPSNPKSLTVANSLTKSKELFIPAEGNNVKWYACGPTVYAPSHMGHARTYISFDIIRRIMKDYFGYNVNYVMNITDVDDKIIIAARHKFLFDQYYSKLTLLDQRTLIYYIETSFKEYLTEKFVSVYAKVGEDLDGFFGKFRPGMPNTPTFEQMPKYEMFFKIAEKANKAIILSKERISKKETSLVNAQELVNDCRDVLVAFLDKKGGHLISDPKHFHEFSSYWECEYFKDMEMLNVLKPDILTRVTEYVPEIVEFVEKIISNGFAYESDGSVYFSTVDFDKHADHDYAKLEPWSAGNVKLMQEGEGDLTSKETTKKHSSDFVLWKKSKPGEPAWSSPWGMGRPGWHIECSVMASHVLGENLDIHSGGIDLAFPHHDNELAQSEAFHNCKQWVNYFWHTGHLHIEGQKMSKSLKNFITIREALEKYSASQIRIMFLMHNWDSTLDFKHSSLIVAKEFESRLTNFFVVVKAEVNRKSQQGLIYTGKHNFHKCESELFIELEKKKQQIHSALCDSFNTPLVISSLRDLIASTNTYLAVKAKTPDENVDVELLVMVAEYVGKMIRLFGIFSDVRFMNVSGKSEESGQAVDVEAVAYPFVNLLSGFRDNVRKSSQLKEDYSVILGHCDQVREDLVDLGVALDDRADGRALAKFVDKETLLKEREEKLLKEKQKQEEKAARALEAAKKKAEKLLKGKTEPSRLFKGAESLLLYSKWDEQGLPTHDIEGVELVKSKRKKLGKEYDVQIKLHEEYLKSLNK